MKRGKRTCRILKEIRKQIAEANDIEFIVSECQYQGDCLGTCPKCEAEVRYLEQQLEYKRLAGTAITILGISAGVITMATPLNSCANTPQQTINKEISQETISQKDSLISNQKVKEKESSELFGMVEEMPMYPGGQAELMELIKKSIRYPSPAINISGRVVVSFIVNRDGSISDAKVTRSVHPLFDKEALRIVSSLPKWYPGKQNGKLIKVKFTVPIAFNGYSGVISKTEIIETETIPNKESFKEVKGRIMNKKGTAISGAKIYDTENPDNETISDTSGYFKFKLPKSHSLTVTYEDMKNQKIKLGKYIKPYINIVLIEEKSIPQKETPRISIERSQNTN